MADISNTTAIVETSETQYDAFPYESHPFPRTTPQYLYTVGRLFGMEPQDFHSCKVLELGCASGGNIIPLAEMYPGTDFLGIDLSAKQVADGKKDIEAIGLDNVEIRNMSIMDVESDFGTFDYIVVHGVYSWVPAEVQQKILSICKKNLSKNGIAYISYNTLPGWNMVKSVRDMMNYHTRGDIAIDQKVPQARAMLEFIHEAVKNEGTPYAGLLKQELERLRDASDFYIFHDHLESENHPCYFYEFMERAEKEDLAYLAETELGAMMLDNFSPEVVEKLKQTMDIIQIEQYMDFLRDRRFRCTLLRHKEQKIELNIGHERIEEFFLACKVTLPENMTEQMLLDGEEVKFIIENNEFKITDRFVKLAMLVFYEQYNKPISFDDLCEKVLSKATDTNKEQVKIAMLKTLNPMDLAFKNLVVLSSTAGQYSISDVDVPKMLKTSRYFIQKGGAVANMRHDLVRFSETERYIVQYIDGVRNIDEIAACLTDLVTDGTLNINAEDGSKIEAEDGIRESLKIFVSNALIGMSRQAFLL